MSELKLIHALLPLQLVMPICYQNESAYFPAPYVDNQLFCSLCAPKQSHAFNSAGFKTTTRFSSRSSNFLQFHHKSTPETVSEGQKSKVFLGGKACPQTPLLSTSSLFVFFFVAILRLKSPPLQIGQIFSTHTKAVD